MYKIQYNQTTLPEHFISYFTTNAAVHWYNTRQNQMFHLPKWNQELSFVLGTEGVNCGASFHMLLQTAHQRYPLRNT